jgi:hypothetical protein
MKKFILILNIISATAFAHRCPPSYPQQSQPQLVCSDCDSSGSYPSQTCRIIDSRGTVTSSYTQSCTVTTPTVCGSCQSNNYDAYHYDITLNGQVKDRAVFRCNGGASSCRVSDYQREECETARQNDGRCR